MADSPLAPLLATGQPVVADTSQPAALAGAQTAATTTGGTVADAGPQAGVATPTGTGTQTQDGSPTGDGSQPGDGSQSDPGSPSGFPAEARSTPGSQQSQQATHSQQAPPAASSTAATGGVPAASAHGLPAAADHAGHPGGAPQGVAGQVASHLSADLGRLVSRGDGTRRITIKLQPEALGDIRVVLTVRHGEVHVRMAGGETAQQALLHGAPELHRLLESAGATSSQLVVGESSSNSRDILQGGPDGRDARQPFGGQEDPHDQPSARTRDGATSARDGALGGTQPRASADPAASSGGSTRTRQGVDVTM